MTELYFKIMATAILVWWSPNSEPDLAGYRVYWGHNSRQYSDSHFISDTSYVIPRDSGKVYFVAVSAIDTAGNESSLSNEKRIVADSSYSEPETTPDDSVLAIPDSQPLLLVLEYSILDTLDNVIEPAIAVQWRKLNAQQSYPWGELHEANDDFHITTTQFNAERLSQILVLSVNIPRLKQYVFYDGGAQVYLFDIELRALATNAGHASAWAYLPQRLRLVRMGTQGVPVGILRFEIQN